MPGIKADFVQPLEPRHICGICKLVVTSPMQTDCGHIFCNDCLKQAMSSGETVQCPIDGDIISQMFPDNACKREIQKLVVRCRYTKNNGCPWTGTLSNEDIHYIACDYRDEQCPDCGSYMMWTKLKKHAEMECPMRRIICRKCGEPIAVSHEKMHLQKDCPAIEMPCPNNCNPNHLMKRKELNKHLSPEDGDCPFSEVDCPYKPLNCDFTGSRQVLRKHLQDKDIYHQRLIVKRVYNNTQQNTQTTSSVQLLEDQLSNLSIRIGTIEKEHDENAQRLAQLEERMSKFQSQYTGKINSLEKTFNSSAHSMSPAVPVRGTEMAMLSSSENSTQLVHRVPELINKQEELNRAVEKLMSNNVDQELRIQLLEQATYNGILVWKIDEISRRIDEAAKGITVSLFSAPFHSDQRGYKMCARCYLNGDGMGKGTHFSLFFVVMRGLYDSLLRWPFRQRVTMTLLNQSGGRHASDTFRPDVRSSSFQRPSREMNIASGCPRFLRIEDFLHGGYIKEDCIFVKVAVDCSDLYGSPMM